MKRSTGFFFLVYFAFAASAFGQVRPVETENPKDAPKEEVKEDQTEKDSADSKDAEAAEKARVEAELKEVMNLPGLFPAKYQGGLFGFSKKQKGTIKCDDEAQRLVFLGKDGKEKFSLPYDAIQVVYPSQYKVQSGIGKGVGSVPIIGVGLLGSLIKKRKNYMVVQFKDPDADAEGRINFLLDTQDVLRAAINSLGRKAEMKERGDAFMRGKDF